LVFVIAVGIAWTWNPQTVEAQEPAMGHSRLAPSNVDFDLDEWGLEARWRQNIVQRSNRDLEAIHHTGRFVAIEATDHALFMVSAESGRLLGGTRLREALGHAPTDFNDQEVVLVVSGVFYRLNVETNKLSEGWRMSASPFTRPVTYEGEYVIASDATSRVASMNIEKQEPVWLRDAAGPVMNRVQLVDDYVYAAGFRGKLLCLGALGGNERWSWAPPEPGILSTGVVVDGGTAYVGDIQGYIYAIDTNSGSIDWRQIAELGLYKQPVVAGDRVLFLSRKPNLICMDPDAEGDKVAWKASGIDRIVTTGKNRVYAMQGATLLKAIDLQTGETVWQDRLPPRVQVTGGAPGEGTLYLANREGIAVAFGEPQD
jgi:outer membrane protein assembly factor BamB